ncbi:acyl-CoA hydrolase [Chitinivorax tropicus]|uniref:Acyl-CoA hydrolase n=1 Tax=Chitinivorax tropicus TaxID=714531 RepID=A0A840MS39_9PROT|nr:thioesterase family protein [Chitinivorax tropicus]MBB5019957.1 acyl-CoA hydrolase [Chitinivorax tropicus]
MSVDQFLQHIRHNDSYCLPDDWMQGRTVYGGIAASLLLEVLLKIVPADRQPRTLTASFIGPAVPGPVTVRTELYRSGKYVTQAQAWLEQNGEVVTTLLVGFGAARDSVLQKAAAQPPQMPSSQSLTDMPFIPGVMPEFVKHLQFRWALDEAPFSGKGSGHIGGWQRLRESGDSFGPAHILMLLDAWPVAALPLFPKPAPFSTLNWTVEFLCDWPIQTPAEGWWQFHDHTDFIGEGYAHTQAQLWSPAGLPVALSRQTVSIFL